MLQRSAAGFGERQFEHGCHPHEGGERTGLHLPHDLPSM
jgi:hypothetical protein